MNTLSIPNISCGHCVRAVTEIIKGLDPTAKVHVDIANRTAAVESVLDLAAIGAKLAENGYPVSAV